jgi:hypothetical protein
MPSRKEGMIEVKRKETIYRGSYLVKEKMVIVRFGNARASARIGESEPHVIAQTVLDELVDKAVAGKKPAADKKRRR